MTLIYIWVMVGKGVMSSVWLYTYPYLRLGKMNQAHMHIRYNYQSPSIHRAAPTSNAAELRQLCLPPVHSRWYHPTSPRLCTISARTVGTPPPPHSSAWFFLGAWLMRRITKKIYLFSAYTLRFQSVSQHSTTSCYRVDVSVGFPRY